MAKWKTVQDKSCDLITDTPDDKLPYWFYLGPPIIRCNVSRYIWDWTSSEFDDSGWKDAITIGLPQNKVWEGVDGDTYLKDRLLVPREIPMMEMKPQRFFSLRRWSNVEVSHCTNWPQEPCRLKVQPRTEAVLVLDQRVMTNGFFEIELSRGRGANVTIGYAEAFYKANLINMTFIRGDRNYVGNLTFMGIEDEYLDLDGGRNRTLRSYWWRSWRYVQVKIQTADQPLFIEDIRSEFTAFPLKPVAQFVASDPELEQMWEIGYRTNQLIAHETYMDCPYYEQGQYSGDSLISALVTFYNTGEHRLWRRALEMFDASRQANGFTWSRTPAHLPR